MLQVISYDSTRGGVSVITEKGEVTTSYLLIQHADISDSGKYSCSPSNADVASVRVHVLNGKLRLFVARFSTLKEYRRASKMNKIKIIDFRLVWKERQWK